MNEMQSRPTIPGLENLSPEIEVVHVDLEITAGEKVGQDVMAQLLVALIKQAALRFFIFDAELRQIYWQSPYNPAKDMLSLVYLSAQRADDVSDRHMKTA